MKIQWPCSEHQIGLILVPFQLRVQLWSPTGDVPDPVLQVVVHISLAGHSSPIPVSYQSKRFSSDPLRLLPWLVWGVVVVDIGVSPFRGAELAVSIGGVGLPWYTSVAGQNIILRWHLWFCKKREFVLRSFWAPIIILIHHLGRDYCHRNYLLILRDSVQCTLFMERLPLCSLIDQNWVLI